MAKKVTVTEFRKNYASFISNLKYEDIALVSHGIVEAIVSAPERSKDYGSLEPLISSGIVSPPKSNRSNLIEFLNNFKRISSSKSVVEALMDEREEGH